MIPPRISIAERPCWASTASKAYGQGWLMIDIVTSPTTPFPGTIERPEKTANWLRTSPIGVLS